MDIPNPEQRLKQYPHEFSGGMRQRVMIAMAVACQPKLVIADEPTTALDVTIQAQVLELLDQLKKDTSTSIIMITHDLGVIASMCKRILVMYGASCASQGTAREIFILSRSPPTPGVLLQSIPRITPAGRRKADPHQRHAARHAPPAQRLPVRAALPLRAAGLPEVPRARHGAERHARGCVPPDAPQGAEDRKAGVSVAKEALIEARDLKMYFQVGNTVFGKRKLLKAVDGVSFGLYPGETFGLVGESGCGKTTVGRALVRLYEPTGGQILFGGADIAPLSEAEVLPYRNRMQMIFQDPYASLNPRMTVGQIIGDPMAIHGIAPGKERKDRIQELLRMVGLNPYFVNRYPHEFSGGQQQRIGIARALAVDPTFIVADEPVSALDVSIQAQILNLLEELQAKLGLTYVFVAHNLAVVRHISDRVAVMYLGKIVELADRDTLYECPMHPYTKALLSAVPIPDPLIEAKRRRIILQGDVPSPVNPPTGCHFHPRCPSATEECAQEEPQFVDRGGGHFVACWH